MNDKFSNTTGAQCQRFLKALIKAEAEGVTSYYANQVLGIYHPPARIKDLRQKGYRIETLWKTIETNLSNPRRVARYVLIAQPGGQAA